MAKKATNGDKPVFSPYIFAAYPLLWVQTYEEHRAITRFVSELLNSKEKYAYYSWDCADGLKPLVPDENGLLRDGKPITISIEGVEVPLRDPQMVLDWSEGKQCPNNAILFLKDFHEELTRGQNAPIYRRKIRNLITNFKATGKALVIVSPIVKIPDEIEKEITVINFSLPTREDLRKVLKGLCEAAGATYPPEDEEVVDAALGMTAFEAENAFSVSLVEKQCFDPKIVAREKAAVVKKTNVAEIIQTDLNISDIGGLENLKAYLEENGACFTQEARDFGVTPPKGLLLIGVPGCGKSLTAKVTANSWGRPLLRFDTGSIMSKWQGESEQNLNKVLSLASAIAPCVLWIDELEKNFKGAGGETDNGTPSQMLQIILTFMQERKADVIIVATANSVQQLPPEFLSRFSQMFWVDLPDPIQRREILAIHMAKKGQKMDGLDMEALIAASEEFSGREIDQWVEKALKRAFLQKHKSVVTEDLLETAKTISPAARLMKEKIKGGQAWAKERGAIQASITHEAELAKVEAAKPARKIIQHLPPAAAA
jgi:ATP-dependent 26S proteasome regulatory subunit